jgi:hypothetical protein
MQATHKETIHRDRGYDFFLRNDEENGKTKGQGVIYSINFIFFVGPSLKVHTTIRHARGDCRINSCQTEDVLAVHIVTRV